MKRREKEHKNLKMKGGVLSVWFKIKNIKSFNRHPPGCYQKSGRTSLSASLTVETALVLPIFLYLMLGVLFLFSLWKQLELRNRKSMTGQNRWQSMLMIHGR